MQVLLNTGMGSVKEAEGSFRAPQTCPLFTPACVLPLITVPQLYSPTGISQGCMTPAGTFVLPTEVPVSVCYSWGGGREVSNKSNKAIYYS